MNPHRRIIFRIAFINIIMACGFKKDLLLFPDLILQKLTARFLADFGHFFASFFFDCVYNLTFFLCRFRAGTGTITKNMCFGKTNPLSKGQRAGEFLFCFSDVYKRQDSFHTSINTKDTAI